MTDPPLTPVECGTGILLDVLETHAEIPHIQEAVGPEVGFWISAWLLMREAGDSCVHFSRSCHIFCYHHRFAFFCRET